MTGIVNSTGAVSGVIGTTGGTPSASGADGVVNDENEYLKKNLLKNILRVPSAILLIRMSPIITTRTGNIR